MARDVLHDWTMMKRLSNELIAILAVGIAVAGVTLTGLSGIHERMDRMEARIDARFDDLDERLSARVTAGDERLADRRRRRAVGWKDG